MRRRRGDSRDQITVSEAEVNNITELYHKRKRERKSPQAGDNRAETIVENLGKGRWEAGSGLRPSRKNQGLRMADPSGDATTVLFCEEDNVHVTQWKIRTTGIKARLNAQQKRNCVVASCVCAENNDEGTLGGPRISGDRYRKSCETQATDSHSNLR